MSSKFTPPSNLQKSIVEGKQILWNGAVYLRSALAKVPQKLRARLPAIGPFRKIVGLAANATPTLTYELFKEKLAEPGSLELRNHMARFITEFQQFSDSKTTEYQLQNASLAASVNVSSSSARETTETKPSLSASVPVTASKSENLARSFNFSPFQSSRRDEMIAQAQAERGETVRLQQNKNMANMPDSPSPLQFRRFVDKMIEIMQNNPIWSAYVVADDESIRDCIETEVIPKLHNRLYIVNRDRDVQFASYLDGLSFITPKHLDIKVPVDETLVTNCGELLSEINFEMTPHKKLFAIHKCCKLIFDYLRNPYLTPSTHPSKSAAVSAAQAREVTVDDFLPVLIYIVIRSNPFGILSQISYIFSCRGADSTRLEENYYLTSLEIAVKFLEQLQPHQLSDPPSESIDANWVLLDSTTQTI